MKEKELKEDIKEAKELLKKSKTVNLDSSICLTKLNPEFNKANKLIKNKLLEEKLSVELNRKLRSNNRDRISEGRENNISRNTINIGKKESKQLITQQYKNKISVFEERKSSHQTENKNTSMQRDEITEYDTEHQKEYNE